MYHGRARVAATSGRACIARATTPRATVPTAKEMRAALTGEPTAMVSLALVGACREAAAPPRITASMAKRDGFIRTRYQLVAHSAPANISANLARVARWVSSGRA